MINEVYIFSRCLIPKYVILQIEFIFIELVHIVIFLDIARFQGNRMGTLDGTTTIIEFITSHRLFYPSLLESNYCYLGNLSQNKV